MEKSFGLFFYVKKPKGYRSGPAPVYLRITVNGSSCDLSSKRACCPEQWNVPAGRMKGKGANVIQFNAFLEALLQQVYDAKRALMEKNLDLSSANIKSVMQGRVPGEHKTMLLHIFKKHNEQMCALVPAEYAPGTLERYKTSLQHTAAYIQWKYRASDIDINKLDYDFISDYEFWLRSIRKCNHNSAKKYLSNFRKIINLCLKRGLLAKDPFYGYSMAKKEVDRTALTPAEIELLKGEEFLSGRLQTVRDIFLFSCYTGLAYADVKGLRKSDLFEGVDGTLWLSVKRQKTGVPSRLPVLPTAAEILEQYSTDPVCGMKNVVLPVLSNQKMNVYLKELAGICGITKDLTFHIARHTFATTITLTNGVPMETVSKMLGHRNIKTTQLYAKILDQKIGADMATLRQKLSKK